MRKRWFWSGVPVSSTLCFTLCVGKGEVNSKRNSRHMLDYPNRG